MNPESMLLWFPAGADFHRRIIGAGAFDGDSAEMVARLVKQDVSLFVCEGQHDVVPGADICRHISVVPVGFYEALLFEVGNIPVRRGRWIVHCGSKNHVVIPVRFPRPRARDALERAGIVDVPDRLAGSP